jgi:hypothetical protein
MLLAKLPVPLPSVVFVFKATVGLLLVLQHTPLAVTAAPPSLVILPPLLAVVLAILVIVVVLKVGKVMALMVRFNVLV